MIAIVTTLAVRVESAEPQETVLAETLFREGKAAMDAGRYEEACPKLAQSVRLDRAGGTQLALGLCYERAGKHASAWVALLEAVALAQQDRRKDREKIAREHAAMAEKQAPRVTITVGANERLPGFEVFLDGVAVPAGMWSTALPVDPGSHEVRVTAPEKRAWSTSVVLTQPGELSEVTVPPLEALPAPKVSEPRVTPERRRRAPAAKTTKRDRRVQSHRLRKDPESSGISQQTIALGCGGLGIALLATGTVFGVRALSKADEVCNTPSCPPNQRDEYDDYRTSANIANVTFGLGVLSLGVSIVLLLTDSGSEDAPDAKNNARWRPLAPQFVTLPSF